MSFILCVLILGDFSSSKSKQNNECPIDDIMKMENSVVAVCAEAMVARCMEKVTGTVIFSRIFMLKIFQRAVVIFKGVDKVPESHPFAEGICRNYMEVYATIGPNT